MRLLDILRPKRDEGEIDRTLEESSKKSHDLLNSAQKGIMKIQRDMRHSKKRHTKELEEYDRRLSDVSMKIAAVTGGLRKK